MSRIKWGMLGYVLYVDLISSALQSLPGHNLVAQRMLLIEDVEGKCFVFELTFYFRFPTQEVDVITTDCLALREQVAIYEEQLAAMERQHQMVRPCRMWREKHFVTSYLKSEKCTLDHGLVEALLFKVFPLIIRGTGLGEWRLTEKTE